VVEAKNLPKSSDYVAEIHLDTERQARTQVKTGTNEPYWGQTFDYDHVPLQMTRVLVQVIRSVSMVLWDAPGLMSYICSDCSVPSNFGQSARHSAAVFKRRVAQIARVEQSPRRSK
jgi:hypothetical protein